MCFTYWIVLHFKSSSHSYLIRMKLNQDLIAWRDMAGRNWITTILSHHGWCTWTTVINGQGIIAEKTSLFIFLIWQFQRILTYPQLGWYSTSKVTKNWSLPAARVVFYIKRYKIDFYCLSHLHLNQPSQVKVIIIMSRKPRWCDDTTSKTIAVRTGVCVDIHTTIPTIIITFSNIFSIITDTITN